MTIREAYIPFAPAWTIGLNRPGPQEFTGFTFQQAQNRGVPNEANSPGQDCFGASLLAMTVVRAGAIVSNKPNSARPEPGNSKSQALNPNGIQRPEDEHRNVKRTQFGGRVAPNEPNFPLLGAENEGRAEKQSQSGSRGRLEGKMSNKANLGDCRSSRRAGPTGASCSSADADWSSSPPTSRRPNATR